MINSIPERLSRITSGGRFIKEIDGMRFIAIMPVLVQHMAERFERNTPVNFTVPPENNITAFLASHGFIGVYIFFVISGFILSLPFARYKLQSGRQVKLFSYYWRRITRLEPPYILWTSLFFIVFVIHGHKVFTEVLPHYLASLTYTHGLFYHQWSPINPPTWTLEIEIQFYIAAPFLALAAFNIRHKIARRALNLVLILSLMLIQQHFKLYTNPYNLTILGHLHYFLIGFMLADIYLCDWNSIKKNTVYDFIALAAIIALIFSWSWDFELHRRLLFAASLFVLFFAVFKGNYVNRFISNRWISAIGGMCYTIYLIHLPFSEFLIAITKNIHITNSYTVNLIIQLLIFLPLIICLSAVFFLLFEKPFMDKNWPRNLTAKIKNIFNHPKPISLKVDESQ